MNLKSIHNTLYNDNIDIRKRVFVMNVLNIIIILGITNAEILFVPNLRVPAISALLLVVLIVIVGVWSVKNNRIDRGGIIITALMSYIYFPVTFRNSGGVTGIGVVWFLFIMFLICLLLRDRARNIMFALNYIVLLVLYFISYKFPGFIPKYDSALSFIYSFTTLLLICSSVIIMLAFQSRLYEISNAKAKKQKEEIEALNASQNQFFSSMSHEIRTPINTIIGLNEMILREDVSDEVAEDAANIRVAGKLLLNLINDILDMSKFQAGDMHLLIEPYSPGNMLSDLVGMLWIRAKEKNLEFKTSIAPDIPVELMGDEVRIKQVLMNVLNNAIKYTKEGSISLTVECEKKEDNLYNIIYTVSDTGMGIKKEDIPYLFTAFKRVDEGNTKHIEGTGLGLSIVKQFVDLMEGKVTVNSVYTKGTSFIVEIPQKATTEEVIGEYDYEKKHGIGKRQEYKQKFEAPDAKILVVDDNQSNLLVVTKLLRETKIQIDTATSGEDALKMTLNKKYHMIFMDHLMPNMDGIECFRKIRSQAGGKCRETNIVILTANAGEENRELYAREGFDGYLVKPVSGEELENEVYRMLPKDVIRITSESGEIIEDTVTWMKVNQKKRRVAITTESVADIPVELLNKYHIEVIPHKVRTEEGTTFKDGIEIDTAGVLSYMENSNGIMHPISPSVKEHEIFFADQLQLATNVVHISISEQVQNSGFPYAKEAGNSFENVKIVDSGYLSSGEGIIALAAARMADAGMNTEEIIERLERIKKRVHTSFVVDNLDYLARSEQVSVRSANIVKSIMARPVLVMKNGRMVVGKIFFGTRESVWKRYIDSCLSGVKIDDTILFITYVGLTKKELEWIRNRVEKKHKFNKVFFQQASPAIAANCGPGTFGIIFTEQG